MARKRKIQANIVDKADANGENSTFVDIYEVEKQFADIMEYHRKQKNNLLGVFKNGEYSISNEFVERLKAIPKLFEHFDAEKMYASIKLASFVLNFRVDMDIKPDFCKAKLYIIEMEKGIEEDTKHVTLLDELLEVYSPNFRSHFENKWNIIFDEQSVQKDDFLEGYLSMQSEEFRFNAELYEVLSQLYVMRILVHLNSMGELGDKIVFEFKSLMDKHLDGNPGLAQDFTFQKELLDYTLTKFDAFKEIVKTPEGAKILQGFSTPLKNVRDKTYPSILQEPTIVEKKEKVVKVKKVEQKKEDKKKKPEVKKKTSTYDIAKGYKNQVNGGPVFVIRSNNGKSAAKGPQNVGRKIEGQGKGSSKVENGHINVQQLREGVEDIYDRVTDVEKQLEKNVKDQDHEARGVDYARMNGAENNGLKTQKDYGQDILKDRGFTK